MHAQRTIAAIAATAVLTVACLVALFATGISSNHMTGPSSALAESLPFSPPAVSAPPQMIPEHVAQVVTPILITANPKPLFPTSYTVRSGDTLGKIAEREYGHFKDWPVIYYANHIKYANVIQVGLKLTIPRLPARIPAIPAVLAPPAPKPVLVVVDAAPAVQHSSVSSQQVSTAGMSAFQACVISRESGGNPQIWNASGHWGLYQFSYSTWVAYGGAPSLFGNASASYQTQIFDNAMATSGGANNWAPYDGC